MSRQSPVPNSGRRMIALLSLPVLCCLGHLALLTVGAGWAGALVSVATGRGALAAVLALTVLAVLAVLTTRALTKETRR